MAETNWREIATFAGIVLPILLPVFLPVISSSLSNLISDSPNLDIVFLAANNGTHSYPSIAIDNKGKLPATNLTVDIKTPGILERVMPTFYSNIPANYSTLNNTIKISIPKMVQGGGAKVAFMPVVKLQNSTDFYTAYSVYDQGSESFDSAQNSARFDLQIAMRNIIGSAWFWVVYTIGYALLIIILYHRRKRTYISNIKKESTEVYEELMGDINSKKILPKYWLFYRRSILDILRGRNKTLEERRKYVASRFMGIDEYLMVEEFYRMLGGRNKMISSRYKMDASISVINESCLELSKRCLTTINWKKYI